MLLLAQLVAPPLQPGPVRLPNTAPQQRPKDDGPLFEIPPGSPTDPKKPESDQDDEAVAPSTSDWRPDIVGKTPYTEEQINSAESDLEGLMEIDALIAYLQILGTAYSEESE